MKVELTPTRLSRREIALSVGGIIAGIVMGAGGVYEISNTPKGFDYPLQSRALPTATIPASRIESGAPESATAVPTADFHRFIKYIRR